MADPVASFDSGDTAWMIVATALVLLMTLPGLALLYAGMVRVKNTLSVLMQCFAIAALVTVLWVAYGYSLAFTTPGLSTGAFLWEVTVFTIVSAIITFPSLVVWCLFGVAIAQVLQDERKRRLFNYTLAALLVLSIGFLFV